MLQKRTTFQFNKTFVGLILLLSFAALIVFTNKMIPLFNIKFALSSLIRLPRELTPEQCRLSMLESDNWFCELDSDWKRRKMVHYLQNKDNRKSNLPAVFFDGNWEPTVHCPFEQRLGNAGDGGKWICDVHRYGPNSTRILVYSLGSYGDFGFERSIRELYPKAEIHTFDKDLYSCPKDVCTFHQVRIGNGKNESSKSLRRIIKELDHEGKDIAILKIDIEGSEYEFFYQFFHPPSKSTAKVPYIRQILLEIHLQSAPGDGPSHWANNLFEWFRSNNYAIFHKEVNLHNPSKVFEYAFLRLNPLFFVRPT